MMVPFLKELKRTDSEKDMEDILIRKEIINPNSSEKFNFQYKYIYLKYT